MYQQGDVLIKKVDSIPEGSKKLSHCILAEGEATGHKHIASPPSELFELDGKMYLITHQTTEITHEEHKPITLPPGFWHIDKVREYDAFEQETRKVID